MTQDNPQNVDPELWRIAKNRVGFKQHLTVYMIVIPFLWAIWAVSAFWSGTQYLFPWPVWPTLGWGLGLFMNYIFVYVFPGGSKSKQSIQREYEKLQNKY